MKAFKKRIFWSIIALLAVFLAVPQVFAQGAERQGEADVNADRPYTAPGVGKGPESGIYKGRTIADQPYQPAGERETGVEYEGRSAHRASQLIGKRVVSSSGETVGTLHDIVLFEGGGVHYGIVSVDNRTEEKYVPIPFDSLTGVEGEDRLTVRLDRNTLENAPGFSENELATWWNTDIGEQVHGYYGDFQPYTAPGVGKDPESGIYKGRTITDKPYQPTE